MSHAFFSDVRVTKQQNLQMNDTVTCNQAKEFFSLFHPQQNNHCPGVPDAIQQHVHAKIQMYIKYLEGCDCAAHGFL